MPKTTRRTFIKSAALLSGAGLISAGCSTQNKPNVLFIFSDQQHWHALGFLDDFFYTPNLNDFVRNSVVFENGFCTTPQCSPSRSSIFTGFYPHKTGVLGNMGAAGGEPLAQPTLLKILHDNGYKTAYAGKWHLGPNDIAQTGIDHVLFKEGKQGAKCDEPTTQDGLQLLNDPKFTSGPFALFLSYVDPHDIYAFRQHDIESDADIELPYSWEKQNFDAVPKVHRQFMTEDQGTAIWGKPQSWWEQYRDCYRAKVKLYDEHIGRIMSALKKQGLWDNTIIVNTSDHGDMDTHNHLIWKGPFMYEHMVRVPFMIRVPEQFGGVNNRRISDMDVVNVDFVPTLLDLCDIPKTKSDGLSLKPILTQDEEQEKRDFVIGQYYSKQKWINPIRMIRTSEFKYSKTLVSDNSISEELYDLQNDPDELINLADENDYQDIKNELKSKLDNWIENNDDPFYSLFPTDRAGHTL